MNKDNNKSKNKLLQFFSKYKLYLFICLFIIIFLALFIVFVVNKSFFAIDSNGDAVILSCPEVAGAGSEFECSVNVNVATVAAQGFEADIELSDGLEFKSFTRTNNCPGSSGYQLTGGNCWDTINGSDSKLLVYNQGNDVVSVTGNTELGILKYKIPDNASSNTIYKVNIKNPFLAYTDTDDEVKSLTLSDVTASVRISSNINTLTGISLSTGSINEQVTPDRNNYTAIVNDDKVTVNVVKSDNNSTISGNLNDISLHYGTNVVNFKVISEDGKEKVYTITITRPYELSTDKYIYNKDNNYIYTGNDIAEYVIMANINLDSGLTSSILDGKYIVKYDNEVLLSVDIININMQNYTLSDNKIYINEAISIDTFKSSVVANGVNIKIFDGNNEVSTGNIKNNYKMKVYYGNTLLDEYSIVSDYFNLDKDLIVDDTNKIINRIESGTKYSNIKEKINTSGVITIKDVNGALLNDNDIVKTGDVIEIELNNETKRYTISVLGDVNGDGIVSVNDINLISKSILNNTKEEVLYFYASDYNNDSKINVVDIVNIANYIIR